MEIIVLPYIAISFVIGWAVFSPFSKFDDLGRLTFDRIATSDLLATFLPLSFSLATFRQIVPADSLSIFVLIFAGTFLLSCAIAGLIAGLFLFDKMERPSSLKRMATIGIIIPLGSLFTLAWIALPLAACVYSVSYAIPATLLVLPATLLLRSLSAWVCSRNSGRQCQS